MSRITMQQKWPTTAGVLISVALLAAACAQPTPTPTAVSTPTRIPPTTRPTSTATATPSPSPSPTATFTPSPTHGPGLDELMLTPEAFARERQAEDALAAYEELAALYPDSAEPRIRQSALAQGEGDFEAARRYLEQAVQAEPSSLEALHQFALLLEQQQDYEELADIYHQMLGLDPDNADLHGARAITLVRLGRTDEAVGDLEKLFALDPSRAYAWLNATAAASSQRHYQTAISLASAGLTHGVEEPGLLLERGLAYLSSDDPDSALADFDALLAVDKLNVAGYLWRGRVLAGMQRNDEALVDLQRAAELGVLAGISGVNTAYEAMADAADVLAQEDPQEAFSYLAGQVFVHGSRSPLMVGYARIDWRRGNPELAISRLNPLIEDGYLPALYWRGKIYADERQYAEAAADLEAFLDVRHSGPEAEQVRRLLASLQSEGDR